MKRCLKKSIGRANLSFDELHTVIVEIESILNARPITYLYDDQEGISTALSPSHLVYGRKITTMPNSETFEVISTHQSLTRRAKHHKHLLSQFTMKWRKDYLLSLREHHRQGTSSKGSLSIKLGDVVLVKGDLSNRAFWRLGVVEELLPGRDDNVRAAVVKVADKSGGKRAVLLRRSIKHLYPLEVKAQSPLSERARQVALNPPTVLAAELSEEHQSTQGNDETLSQHPRRQAAIAGEKLRRGQK